MVDAFFEIVDGSYDWPVLYRRSHHRASSAFLRARRASRCRKMSNSSIRHARRLFCRGIPSLQALQADGKRPALCRRSGCSPLLDAIESDPRRRWRDEDLRDLGLEPVRVRRHFQAKYGMTFQAYMRARRLGARRSRRFAAGAEIDDVVFDIPASNRTADFVRSLRARIRLPSGTGERRGLRSHRVD